VRNIMGFLTGVLVLGVVVLVLQQLSFLLHPVPDGLDPMDPADAEAFAAFLATMPMAAWAAAMLSEVVGAACGAFAAGWISRDASRLVSGLIVGFATIASGFNWISFPHPTWFIVAQLVGYPLALMGVWTALERMRPPAADG